jgi:hypothetical protein
MIFPFLFPTTPNEHCAAPLFRADDERGLFVTRRTSKRLRRTANSWRAQA